MRWRLLFFCTLVAGVAGVPWASAQETSLPVPAARAAVVYTVQLVPFTELAEARTMLDQMAQKGYPAYIYESAEDQERRWFAVRIGHYADIGEARQALMRFKRAERMPAFIAPSSSLTPVAIALGAEGGAGAPAAAEKPSLPVPAAAATAQAETQLPAPEAAVENQGAAPAAPSPAAPQSLQQQVEALNKKVQGLEQEAEARKILRLSEKEQTERESDILSAAGREYTLIPKGRLGLEYDFQYDYLSSDVLQDLRSEEGNRLAVERRGNHTLTNTLLAEVGILDNFTASGSIPFVYKYDSMGEQDEREVTDLGDIGLGIQYQPFKAGKSGWNTILSIDGSLPTGRSPYKIDPNKDLATGSGGYTAGAGLTVSKTFDPVVAFGNLNYTYRFKTERTSQRQSNGKILTETEPGESLGFSLGLGYALSHKTSLNLSYQCAYHLDTRYHFEDETSFDSGTWVSSMFSLGAGWRISPKYSVFVRVGIGLTNDDPDFSFAIRIPVQFDLGE